MAPKTASQLDKIDYTISPNHDLVVRVVESKKITQTVVAEDGTTSRTPACIPTTLHTFRVNRATLAASSDYLNKLLYTSTGDAKPLPGGRDVLDVPHGHPLSFEVWLKILHAADVRSTLRAIDIKGLYRMLATAAQYAIEPRRVDSAKQWFERWWANNQQRVDDQGTIVHFDFKDYQMLLYPCHAFSHAKGFQHVTQKLVYGSVGVIAERKPAGTSGKLRLPDDVMHTLNASKTALITTLHRALYAPITHLLTVAKCDCKVRVLFAYQAALTRTGAWPLEEAFLSTSIDQVLAKLDRFDMSAEEQLIVCADCGYDLVTVVDEAVEKVRERFLGFDIRVMRMG